MNMKVLLTQDVRGLGRKGQIIEVSVGHGRNFLIAKGLARAADEGTQAAVAKKQELKKQSDAAHVQEITLRAQELKGKVLEFSLRTDEKGSLFGAVNGEAITKALREKKFVGAERVQAKLEHPLKKAGDYEVMIDFGKGVTTKITVRVQPQK